ncbi:cytoskeletal motor fibril protein Fib [Spiroplasma endosymbiont of Aspidapion aeneum]|uniref:cytoskeletal motor fibril protein Fib n=1 Tax=Spiroplasma endosymbiont of Aspidapion aeneum TaxID=3066276 RepID=UPI00313B517E
MIGIITTAYFSVKDREGIKTLKKYWWRNVVIQIVRFKNKSFIIATTGYGKANAAMAMTYLMEKYAEMQTVINIDLALSTNDKFDTASTVLGTKFIYRDADLTVFKDIKYGQIVHEPEAFTFNDEFVQEIRNFKLGVSDGIIGTADMLIYNSKQFKEMVDKYGQSIDVIDTEAGAIAQVAKKSSIGFLSLKIMYNNALSPWDNDPLHKFKMYETSNTLKYLVARLFNLLSSKYVIDFSKCNNDELEAIFELYEWEHDGWIAKFKANTAKLLSGIGPSLLLVDGKEKTSEALDIIEVMKPKFDEEGPSKVILGEDEWKHAPKKWLRKMLFLENYDINDDELLWNKSAKYDVKVKHFSSIEDVCKNISKAIADKCQDKSSYTYEGATVVNKNLLVTIDMPITFYISNNATHEFVEDKTFGTKLVSNEVIKHLNEMLKETDSPFAKIKIFAKIPALRNKRISMWIESKNKINSNINFGTWNKGFANKYTVVDIMRTDYDPIKVGSFKVTVRLKPE